MLKEEVKRHEELNVKFVALKTELAKTCQKINQYEQEKRLNDENIKVLHDEIQAQAAKHDDEVIQLTK